MNPNIIWTTKDGRELLISEIPDLHLLNIYRFLLEDKEAANLARCPYSVKNSSLAAIQKEVEKRKLIPLGVRMDRVKQKADELEILIDNAWFQDD